MNAPNLLNLARTIQSTLFAGKPLVDVAAREIFLTAFVRQANAAAPVGMGRWGRKSRASRGGPVSTGTVAYWLADGVPVEPTNGLIDAVDLLSGSGNVQWLIDPPEEYQNIHAMWWPVEGAPVTDDKHDGDDKQEPADDDPDAPIVALINVLEQLVDVGDRLVMALDGATKTAESIRHDGVTLRLTGR